VVGVDDRVIDANQQAVFEVYIDGVRKRREQISFRHPKKITVDVAGGVRLRLLASIGYVDSPLQAGANIAGGVPNHLPHVGWGSAQISK